MNFFLLLVVLSLCVTASYSTPIRLQEKFQHAQVGDYIVTEQEGSYCLFLLRSMSANRLLLEEVLIPSEQVHPKTLDWQTFLKDKAPGHTSWTAYEIDLKTGALLECFSYSKNGWIYLDEQEQLFSRLFSFALTPVPDMQRKRIGIPPPSGEKDNRKIWNPPLFSEGKKSANPIYEVVQASWPDDGSKLSLCDVELYFDATHPHFPFPYWIEVKSPHYTCKIRAITSGHALTSPTRASIPHRPPEITGFVRKTPTAWELPLRAPLYHDAFHLFALDLTAESCQTIEVPHRMERQEKESLVLQVNPQDLKTLLTQDHRYRWLVISDKLSSTYAESEETFMWKHE